MLRQPSLFDEALTPRDNNGLVGIAFRPCFSAFRLAARRALHAGLTPEAVWWAEDPNAHSIDPDCAELRVPKAFVSLAKFAACHRSPDRWSLLYQLLWRLKHGEPHLLALGGDPLVARLHRYDKAVHRDLHKMKAFVRFKRVEEAGDERFIAWFEPEHHIVELAAHFFARRYTNMRWSVLTPLGCAHWDGDGEPLITPGLDEASQHKDDLDELWQTYYRHIFNPARVKTDAMRAEMPQKYWKHLPEAAAIPGLLRAADGRVDNMLTRAPGDSRLQCGERPASYSQQLLSTMQFDDDPSARLAAAVRGCTDCELWRPATQAVPGEGPVNASVIVVGEQPGDQEDLAGRPFVGPAGRLLDSVLDELGVHRSSLYLTNAVKHFRFRPTPKRRLHEKPREGEVHACRQWLMRELEMVDPALVICLGVTAATSVFGRPVRMRDVQGHVYRAERYGVLATVHPAAVLRSGQSDELKQRLTEDLRRAFQYAEHAKRIQSD